MLLSRIITVCLIAAAAAFAQPPQNARSVTLAHIDLNSADPDAAIAFWKDVLGTSTYSHESLNGVSTLGALIVFARSAPAGPSMGSAIDYLGFKVPELQPIMAKLAKTSFKSFQPTPGGEVLMIDGPDGVRIELTEDNAMYAPLEFAHIHLQAAKPKEAQAWYAKYFGARPVEDQLNSSRIGGAMLTFTQADSVQPSAGRAIDHLSFEVKDLAGFGKTLADDGIKLDPPLASGSSAKFVFLTDPWGIRIQLIESAAH